MEPSFWHVDHRLRAHANYLPPTRVPKILHQMWRTRGSVSVCGKLSQHFHHSRLLQSVCQLPPIIAQMP